MVWFLLIIAGLFETAWALGLKYTGRFYPFVAFGRYADCHDGQFPPACPLHENASCRNGLCRVDGNRHCRYGRSGYFPVQRTAFMAKNSISSDDSGGHRRLEVAGVNPVVSDGQSSFARLMMEAWLIQKSRPDPYGRGRLFPN